MDSILSKIANAEYSATKTEKTLIKALKNIKPEDLIYYSITELAEHANVAEATILRFCKKLGLRGYQEFRLVIARDITASKDEETQDGYASEICKSMKECLDLANKSIDYGKIDEAVELILGASRIHWFGVGNSATVAVEAQNRLIKLGYMSSILPDTHMQTMQAVSLGEKDVMILVSVSGSTKELIELAHILKQNNVKIILMTNYLKSPLGKYADVILYTVRREAPVEGGSLLTKVAQIYLLDVLCTGIYLKDKARAQAVVEKTAKIVVGKLV